MKAVFILLAGGGGRRFGSRTPKQFLPLRGKPLIYWSLLNTLQASESLEGLILALPRGWNWKRLKAAGAVPNGFPFTPVAVPGGKSRPESLKKALRALPASWRGADTAVFVHDAARPAWPKTWIPEMLKALKKHRQVSGVIPMLPVRDTVKFLNGNMRTIAERSLLYFSQTPQLLRLEDFERALKRWGGRNYWDEAQVLEHAGKKLLSHPGNPLNLKITYAQDLQMLESCFETAS